MLSSLHKHFEFEFPTGSKDRYNAITKALGFKGQPGRSTRYSKEDAVKIATALVMQDNGFSLAEAAAAVRKLGEQLNEGNLTLFWMASDTGDVQAAITFTPEVGRILNNNAALRIINAEAIRRRVDRIFKYANTGKFDLYDIDLRSQIADRAKKRKVV